MSQSKESESQKNQLITPANPFAGVLEERQDLCQTRDSAGFIPGIGVEGRAAWLKVVIWLSGGYDI